MRYHIFRARVGNEVAITDDGTGSKLPTRQVAWAYLRPIEINSRDGPAIGANSQDIVSGATPGNLKSDMTKPNFKSGVSASRFPSGQKP